MTEVRRRAMQRHAGWCSIRGGLKNRISIAEMRKLVEAFGFRLSRVQGSHHIFVHPHVTELVNLQNVKGKAKPYQVRQFLKLVEEYNLTLEDDGP